MVGTFFGIAFWGKGWAGAFFEIAFWSGFVRYVLGRCVLRQGVGGCVLERYISG